MQTIAGRGVPIKTWTKGVQICPNTLQQLENLSSLPLIYKHIAVMPDAHLGKGATVGTVLAMQSAVIPSAVGYAGEFTRSTLKITVSILDVECVPFRPH